MWGGYRIGARLLGYEVTVRPAGIEGRVCGFEGGGMVRQGGEILPSPIGFVCQWHESGSGLWVQCLVC